MKQWSMVIDVEKCEDCNNCFLACKDEHVDNDWPGYSISQPRHGHRWMNIMRKERGQYPMIDVAYLPVLCMHCDNAPCIEASANGAVYKREDGIVIVDPHRAVGQKDIVKSCPYGAIWWNAEKKIPQKCTLCAHLLDNGWAQPRCVQACPSGAMRIHYDNEAGLNRLIESEGLEVLNPQFKTGSRVYYKSLFRYTHGFIAGSVAVINDGVIDCAEGAQVTLVKGTERIGALDTDNFGDFKFDGLEEESGTYELEISYSEYPQQTLSVDMKKSCNVGEILFRN